MRAYKKSAVVNGYLVESGANLSGADLRGADLSRLRVDNVDFSHADLTGANLASSRTRKSNFKGAILKKANLEQCVFARSDLSDAMFEGANLKKCVFVRSDLSDATFEGANLQYTEFVRSALINANFNSAKLRETDFTDSDLRSANLENLVLYEVSIYNCDLRASNLKNVIAKGVVFGSSKFRLAKVEGAKFIDTRFVRSDLSDLNLQDCIFLKTLMRECKLIGVNLSGKNMTGSSFFASKMKKANLSGANLTNCDFDETDLSGADLSGADLKGADLTNAILASTKLDGAKVKSAFFPTPPALARSYGLMTGPILKMSKPESPLRAPEFKKSYPYEFERLKPDMGGRDFNENIKEAIKDKYLTPFYWVVTRGLWKTKTQRLSKNLNRVILLNINTENMKYTALEKKVLQGLIKLFSQNPTHPHAKSPLLTIGWARYAIDEKHKVMLIEEIQTDLHKNKIRTITDVYLARHGVSREELEEAVSIIKPELERFYEDAVGLIYQEAAKKGYTVEMLGYEDKLPFCYVDDDGVERCPPKGVYTDLPRRMGMLEKRDSEVPTLKPLAGKVSYYKPNPGIPPRYRQECCVCGETASLMSEAGDVFCEDCF